LNLARFVHQRLLTQAKATRWPFNKLLQHYVIERFLYRLGQSKHVEQLLLKGALLLSIWQIPLVRPTRDIDVLARIADTSDTTPHAQLSMRRTLMRPPGIMREILELSMHLALDNSGCDVREVKAPCLTLATK